MKPIWDTIEYNGKWFVFKGGALLDSSTVKFQMTTQFSAEFLAFRLNKMEEVTPVNELQLWRQYFSTVYQKNTAPTT